MSDTTLSKTIGTNTIYPRKDRFLIQAGPENGSGAVAILPGETVSLVDALQAWSGYSGRTQRNGTETALLIGGPKHMEFIPLPTECGPRPVYVVHSPPHIFGPDVEPSVRHYSTTYHRVELDGAGQLPFVLYEHIDLRNSNVKRRAEQLDSEIRTRGQELTNKSEAQKLANRRVAEAHKAALKAAEYRRSVERQLAAARGEEASANERHRAEIHRELATFKPLEDAKAALDKVTKERTQIAYDHGI